MSDQTGIETGGRPAHRSEVAAALHDRTVARHEDEHHGVSTGVTRFGRPACRVPGGSEDSDEREVSCFHKIT
jgi:hypothetical protein